MADLLVKSLAFITTKVVVLRDNFVQLVLLSSYVALRHTTLLLFLDHDVFGADARLFLLLDLVQAVEVNVRIFADESIFLNLS